MPEEERYSVSRLGLRHTFRIVCSYGYRDFIFSEHLSTRLLDELRAFLYREITASSGAVTTQPPAVIAAKRARAESERALLDTAHQSQMLYILGKEHLRVKKEPGLGGMLRYLFLAIFIWMRDNTRSKPAELNVPIDKLVEIGFVKEI